MTIVESVWQHAEENPAAVALRGPAGRWSYERLRERASVVAGRLIAAGVRPGDRVVLAAPSVPEFVAASVGAWAAGAVLVSVSPLSAARELEHVVTDCEPALIMAWHEALQAASTVAGDHDIPLWTLDPGLENLNGQTGISTAHQPAPDDTAVILYTSGTTGVPKGAELTWSNVEAVADIFVPTLEFTANDVVGTALPLHHVFGQSVMMGASMRCGASLALLPQFTPDTALSMIGEEQVTVFAGVPTMYNAMLRAPGADAIQSVRMAASGGASLPGEIVREYRERYGCVIVEGYGLTESTGTCTFTGIPSEAQPFKPGSAGRPLPGMQARVRDSVTGEDVPAGEVGELWITGPVIMKGYWKRPVATAETVQDGWLRTGDLVRQDADGDIYVVDRLKDLIIRGGMNIYPREVEEVLYEHPDIEEAAVVGVPDERMGEETGAAIVLRDNATVTWEELRDWAKQQLSPYKVPHRVRFVDELPKNRTGKILKQQLRGMFT